MNISVIICTYNRAERLGKTLESLEKMIVPPNLSWELLIVDNNSSDATKNLVGEYEARKILPIHYLFEGKQGLSHARNTGVRETRGTFVAFTDDDCIVEEAWLASIGEAFDRYKCAAVGGKVLPVWTANRPAWFETDGPFRLMSAIVNFDLGNVTKFIDVPLFGANMAFARSKFEKHGYFRTDLGKVGVSGGGGEDTEFCKRLLDKKEKIVYNASAVVYHPVEKERTTREYFHSWYYNYGKSLIVKSGIPNGAVCYFHVPRYLIREFIERIRLWILSLNPRAKFYHKLELYRICGSIVQAYQTKTRGIAL